VPFDVLRWIVQYLHVFAGVLWFGAGFYTVMVQLPALLALPPSIRAAALIEFGPRQLRYILRLAEVTIAFGIVNAILTGRLSDLPATLASLWGWAIGIGAVLAIAAYVLVQAGTKPAVFRLIAIARRVQQGDTGGAAELPVLARRIRLLGYAQMGLGAAVILLMVTARFS